MPNAVYEYFAYPVGGLASELLMALLDIQNLNPSDQRTNLSLGDELLPVWRITRTSLFHIHESKRSAQWLDIRLYRRNLSTDAITMVPKSYFEKTRNDPLVKKQRRQLRDLLNKRAAEGVH